LRQAVVEAEDRFHARYNELNDNDDFDVNCRQEARTGTKLERRICRAVYQSWPGHAKITTCASCGKDHRPAAGFPAQHAQCRVAQPGADQVAEGARGSAGKTRSDHAAC
jgi:hypothetical protein